MSKAATAAQAPRSTIELLIEQRIKEAQHTGRLNLEYNNIEAEGAKAIASILQLRNHSESRLA